MEQANRYGADVGERDDESELLHYWFPGLGTPAVSFTDNLDYHSCQFCWEFYYCEIITPFLPDTRKTLLIPILGMVCNYGTRDRTSTSEHQPLRYGLVARQDHRLFERC
jgi:hypothetical protein